MELLHHSALARPRKGLETFSHIRCLNVMLCYAHHVACELQVQRALFMGSQCCVCVCARVNTCYHLVQKLLSYCLLSEYVQIMTNQYFQYGCEILVKMEGIKEQTVEEYINTDKCPHILLSHHFIQTICHSNMFQPPFFFLLLLLLRVLSCWSDV